MARLSRATRETIKTILVILIVLILIAIYVVYPLNRTNAMMGRADTGEMPADSALVNDVTAFTAVGLAPDTFRVEADGLTKLAVARLVPTDSQPRGLAILIPSERGSRADLLPLVQACLDSGLTVVTYDQRASGASTGKYHSDGTYEAADLQALIAHLQIHDQIAHPLVVIGYAAGGDAALLTAVEEQRIDALAAINPYLTADRLIDRLQESYSLIWHPFYRTMFWWWYEIRSGLTLDGRDEGRLTAPTRPTLLMVPSQDQTDPAVQTLAQLAPELVKVRPVTTNDRELVGELLAMTRK